MDYPNILGFELDAYQRACIEDNEHNVLVVAGAGSGKTMTILGKIQYLLLTKQATEEQILCISFTNETVNSLKEKLALMHLKVDVYTFHKLGYNILGSDYRIVDESYLRFIIDEYFKGYLAYHKKRKYALNIILRKLNVLSKLWQSDEYQQLITLIETFINLSKNQDYDLPDIYHFYQQAHGSERLMLHIILDIMLIYKRELNSTKQIDFSDMINLASKSIKQKHYPYKYIIVDEFQDTSQSKLNLVLKLMDQCQAKLFAVGDDWQSIYRFSGCDLQLFLNIHHYLPDTKIYYLRNTYRNAQELIKVMSGFIMQNPRQLKKEIVSKKHIAKPLVILYNYSLDEVLSKLEPNNTLVLARNNRELETLNAPYKLTVHKSKGLEANNVVLCFNELIPSKTPTKHLLRWLINDYDTFPDAEERRLFYVAITRTKGKVYILINGKVSPFIKELLQKYKIYLDIKKR